MKVIVASTAGFCMGVRRAVNLALDAARDRPGPVRTLGPLIHNPQVVDLLKTRGVVSASETPAAGTVVIRSHGIPPAQRAELADRGLEVIDATCPRVARVHGIVRGRQARGHLIVVLGDAGHAEVLGILGAAGGQAALIAGPEDAARLPDAERVCLVAQTTSDRELFLRTAEAVRRRYAALPEGQVEVADTICDSTRNRQEEVRALAREVEAIVVVGGTDSANTRRLAAVAAEAGVPAFLAETEADLDPAALGRFRVVGLTAGASTPNWMIRRVYYALRRMGPPGGPASRLRDGLRWLVLSNAYVGLGAGALTLAASRLQGFFPLWREALISMLYAFAVHTLVALADKRALELSEPARARAFAARRNWWLSAGLAATALAAGLAFSIDALTGVLFSLLATVSLLYPVRLLRGREWRFRSLAELPGGKDIFMALGWGAVTVAVPLAHRGLAGPAAAVAAFAMVTGLVFCRALLRDFRDLQADRMVGRETLPIMFGAHAARRLAYVSLGGVAATLIIATAMGLAASPTGWLLLLAVAWSAVCIPLFTRKTVLQGFRAEMITDFVFIVAGLAALL